MLPNKFAAKLVTEFIVGGKLSRIFQGEKAEGSQRQKISKYAESRLNLFAFKLWSNKFGLISSPFRFQGIISLSGKPSHFSTS
jgi:hypothetical protein